MIDLSDGKKHASISAIKIQIYHITSQIKYQITTLFNYAILQ